MSETLTHRVWSSWPQCWKLKSVRIGIKTEFQRKRAGCDLILQKRVRFWLVSFLTDPETFDMTAEPQSSPCLP